LLDGPQNVGIVGPNSVRTGVLKAEAMCVEDESMVMRRSRCFVRVKRSLIFVFPQRSRMFFFFVIFSIICFIWDDSSFFHYPTQEQSNISS